MPFARFLTRNLNLCLLDGEDDDLGGGSDDLLDELGRDDGPGPDLDDDGDNDAETGGKAKGEEKPDDGLDDIFGEPKQQAAAGGAEPDVTKNPSVQAVLETVREKFPKGLSSFIDEYLAPELTKMQQGFDSQMAEVAPWKPLIKNGVTPEVATEALRVAQFIANSPEQALRDVARVAQTRGLNPAEVLGIQVAQAQQAAQQGGQTQAPADEDAALLALLGTAGAGVDLSAEENAPLKAVLQQLAKTQEAAEKASKRVDERSEEETRQQEGRAIADAMAVVKAGFDARNIRLNEKAVMQYAIAYVNGLPASERQIEPLEALKAGAKAWLADVNGGAQALQRRAPKVGGRGGAVGGAGAPKAAAKPKTMEERMAAFVEKAQAGTLVASDD